MRLVSIILIVSLLVPLMPGASSAQIVTQPINSPVQAGQVVTTVAGNENAYMSSVTDDYVLGPNDVLEVHMIVGDNALALDYKLAINQEGKVYFPRVAEISLQGLTLRLAKQRILRIVKKVYKQKFSLSVMVALPKNINVYVTGQEVSTGLKAFPDGSRIADLLMSVGFAQGGSDLSDYVYLKRQTGDKDFQDYKLRLHDILLGSDNTSNMLLRNGDIISVPSIRSYVYVYGDVARSGTFGYVPGQRLSDYINIAGGPTDRANLDGVTITRQEKGEPKVYHINGADIIHRGQMNNDIEILAGDVINVPGNFFYVRDFSTFANTVLLGLTIYNAFLR